MFAKIANSNNKDIGKYFILGYLIAMLLYAVLQ